MAWCCVGAGGRGIAHLFAHGMGTVFFLSNLLCDVHTLQSDGYKDVMSGMAVRTIGVDDELRTVLLVLLVIEAVLLVALCVTYLVGRILTCSSHVRWASCPRECAVDAVHGCC